MDGKRQYLAVSTAAEATQIRNTRMRRSSRKGDDFIEVGTHYETIGRHEEQHHTCFRNWASEAEKEGQKSWGFLPRGGAVVEHIQGRRRLACPS